MKLRRRLLAVVAAVALIALAAVAFLQPNEPAITLPDGSSISLVKVSYGRTQHRVVHGGLLDRVLYGWVPTSWLTLPTTNAAPVRRAIADRARRHIALASTTTNTLVVWFDRRATNATLSNLRVLPADEDGQTFGALSSWYSMRSSSGWRPGFFCAALPVFPKRSAFITLRVFVPKGRPWERVGEFRIRNPAFREYPRWKAQPLPATVSHRGYEFTLESLLSGATPHPWSPLHAPQPAEEAELGSIIPSIRVSRNGQTTHDRVWSSIELEDATGNVWRPESGYDSILRTLNAHTSVRAPTNETLKVRVAMIARNHFDDEALWRIDNLALPRRGQFLALTNIFRRVDGMTVSLVGIEASGADAQHPDNPPRLHFTVRPNPTFDPKNSWRISLVSIADGKVNVGSVNLEGQELTGRVILGFRHPPEMTNANFVLALQKPTVIEFMAKATAP